MIKDRIKNLFILIFCMIISNIFIWYKTGNLNYNIIESDIFVIGIYIITCLIIYLI
ncbi:hypothetical protein JOD41_000866 [Peptoniphilus gorbachii]|uniref:Uncharacterized protein n=1 Tax=Peptoniphilus gorbachii TaxID=411567 RepID=A0A6N3CUS8_9FIRM|nr:hypothetical protein [Peptoniphilus gorbachii]